MASVIEQYEAATPIVSLSRCPFTGEVFETSLDLFGIDGMWWAYNHNYRPYVAPIASYFAWTGALSFDGRLPVIPLQTMVGPAVPFVLPRILEHPNLRAVVSSQLVGEHVGFPVVYFAQPTPHDLERVDDWGHSFHLFLREDGSPTTATSTEYDPDKDFDLAPWIESGKLSWIAPGDLDLKLHGELGRLSVRRSARCPPAAVSPERRALDRRRPRLPGPVDPTARPVSSGPCR